MDTSKEYVLMCEKAVEIQEKFYKDENWYFVYSKNADKCFAILPIVEKQVKREWYVWLPRQDQLQEMCIGNNYCENWLDVLSDFYDYITNRGEWAGEQMISGWFDKDYVKEKSMEQLWMAFVMKEKYGKTWNGEEWLTPTR